MSTTENPNMSLWKDVCKTDPDQTKRISAGNLSGMTSLSGTYVLQLATKQWGPMGKKWRFETVEERYDNGGPICIYPPPTGQPDYDAQVQNIIYGSTHTIKLRLYYDIENGVVTENTPWVEAYGHTPYQHYNRKYSEVQIDAEAPKKSYTDAQKKCLSMLGFCADVYLGFFENPEYLESRTKAARIEKAEDKAAEIENQKREYELWYSEHLELLKTSVSIGELEKLFKICISRVNVEHDSDKQKELIKEKDIRKAALSKLEKQP